MQQACQAASATHGCQARLKRVQFTPHFGASATARALRSSGFVDHVELCGRLQHFPRAGEAGGNDEGVAGFEGPLLTGRVCDADAAASDVAELVLRVTELPE